MTAPITARIAPGGEPVTVRATAPTLRMSVEELAVVTLVAQGRTNPETAQALRLPPHTVRTRLEHVGDRAGTRERAGIVAAACRAGLLDGLPFEAWAVTLTPRLAQTLAGIAEGLTDAQIASRSYLALDTVKTRNKELYQQLCANGRANAVLVAWQLGILPEVAR